MTNELKVIHEQEVLEQSFRIYGSKEEPLFLARDVAYWIEYSQSSVSKLVNMVDEEEKVRKNVTTLGGIQESWFLTEDGLYEVLMQSRKPIAKQFSRLNFQQLIFRWRGSTQFCTHPLRTPTKQANLQQMQFK